MATIKQRRAVKHLSEKVGTMGQVMRKAGYSKKVSETPKKLTDSKGFQELLNEAGLTDEFLNNALHEDIKKKKQNRKAELELAYKLKNRMTEKIEHSGEITQKVEPKDLANYLKWRKQKNGLH